MRRLTGQGVIRQDEPAPPQLGGDRQANSALWSIVLTRMVAHQPIRNYVARRTADGLSKPDIMRCLKRYVARELFPLIRTITVTDDLELAA